MKYFPFLILFSICFFNGCEKYPEGGNIHNGDSKMVGPYWLNGLTIDGIDSSILMSSNALYCPNYQFVFTQPSNEGILNSHCGNFPDNSWIMTGDNKKLILTFQYTASADSYYPLVLNSNTTVTWTIQRLTKSDLWMTTNMNGKELYLKLNYYH